MNKISRAHTSQATRRMDLLPSLTWPRVREVQRQDQQLAGGFGGTVRPAQYQYRPVEHPKSVQKDVQKVEKIEGDIPAKKEKQQRVVNTPPQVQEALEKQKEDAELEPPPAKKRKIQRKTTLF